MNHKDFTAESELRVAGYRDNVELQTTADRFFDLIGYDKARYVYNFTWAGVPLIQLPQDVQLKQELIWEVKPTLVIETGVAWGGSLLLYASLLAGLIDSGYVENGRVVGVEIDWREPSKELLLPHPLFRKYCQIIEGSSTDLAIIDKVSSLISHDDRVLIFLDSNHTSSHVYQELEVYSQFVTPASYLVVEDTTIEWHENSKNIRAWGPGNSPITAINRFLSEKLGSGFEQRRDLTDKLVISGMKDGVLQRVVA